MGSNHINTDTEGAIGSVCIKGFMFKFKSKTPSITKQNTKEIIEGLEDIGIFK